MKRTKILGNILISVGVLFALTRVMFAGAGDGVPSLGDMPLRGHQPTYTNIDPPGSEFTQPFCINPAGVIAGFYFDASSGPHGFVRARDGTITTFDAAAGGVATVPQSINPPGAIAGYYWMPATCFTDSCALGTIRRSPRLMLPVRAQLLSKALKVRTSTQEA